MALSAALALALKDASEHLARQSDGRLLLPYRKRIWAAMGDRVMKGSQAVPGPGLVRRTRLVIMCEQLVLPLWEAAFPNHDGPNRMIRIAEEYLAGTTEFRAAWSKPNSFWSEVDSLMGEGPFPAIYAGYCAAKVALTALQDEQFDRRNPGETTTEDDLDAESWDAAYWASIAHGGGAPGEENSSPERLKEFWRWYLDQAVPTAWDAKL